MTSIVAKITSVLDAFVIALFTDDVDETDDDGVAGAEAVLTCDDTTTGVSGRDDGEGRDGFEGRGGKGWPCP